MFVRMWVRVCECERVYVQELACTRQKVQHLRSCNMEHLCALCMNSMDLAPAPRGAGPSIKGTEQALLLGSGLAGASGHRRGALTPTRSPDCTAEF